MIKYFIIKEKDKINFKHETVLLHETVDALDIKKDGIYIDATLGGAGHSQLLLSKLGEHGKLYAFDQDITAIEHAKEKIKDSRLIVIHDNFSSINQHGLPLVDGILYDLGVSSPQFDVAERGFSYKLEAKLDMRMDKSSELTAYEIVNHYSFHELLSIFKRYGQDPYAKQIARKIEKYRENKSIETTTELAELIKTALPQKELKKKGHPAKKIFQALRIEVNDELGSLELSLNRAIEMLKPAGRLSIISFQPLEDKIVKRFFKEHSEVNVPRGLPIIPDEMKAKLKIIARKPILASEQELEKNNRSHSAKLRVAERINFEIKGEDDGKEV
ncbi:MAG: 16S rRNA (cytosine(1402)-N(4))-methyltransferase RsmH [Lactovum sp.]